MANKFNNPFITDSMTEDEAKELIKIALPLMDASGKVPWAEVEAATEIGYSRGWLIVRHAWISKNAPALFVDWTTPMNAAVEQATLAGTITAFTSKEANADGSPIANAVTNGERRVLSPIVHGLRDRNGLSWGEISVRMGIPESRVRKFYKASGAKKDIGLRIGKGGRFAYQDPTLYLEHRKAEGAQIPVTLKGRPTADQLINAKKAEPKVRKAKEVQTA